MEPDIHFAKSKALAFALQTTENNLLQEIEACKLQQQAYANEIPGSMAFERAASLLRQRRARVRAFRQAYAQAVLEAYGEGLSVKGAILWG